MKLETPDYSGSPVQVTIFLQIFWFIFWIWTESFIKSYKFTFRNKKDELDLINRILSATHGLVIFILSFYDQLYNPLPWSAQNTEAENNTFYFSMTYFIYDTVAMFKYDVSSRAIEAHHFCSIGTLQVVTNTNTGGKLLSLGLFVTEISNVFMHGRKILDNFGMKYTKIRSGFENLYFCLFFVFRGIGGPYAIWLCAITENIHVVELILGLFICVQSYMTFPVMYKLIKKNQKMMKIQKQHKIKKYWFAVNPKIEEIKGLWEFNQKLDNEVF